MPQQSTSLTRARNLRHNQTEAEKRLWGYLRDRRLSGFKFVRQHPIGPYIADFVCRDCMLVVEVDGATHSEDHEIAYDAKRTADLERHGYRVLRLQNADVFAQLPNVLDMILLTLNEKQPRIGR